MLICSLINSDAKILKIFQLCKKIKNYFDFWRLFKQNKANPSINIPNIHDTMALVTMPQVWVKPATMKVRKLTPATVRAYGNCDDT